MKALTGKLFRWNLSSGSDIYAFLSWNNRMWDRSMKENINGLILKCVSWTKKNKRWRRPTFSRRMTLKADTGFTELALNNDLVQKLNLDYIDTVPVSTPTDINVSTDRHRPVLMYWNRIVTTHVAYCIPLLDSALLGLRQVIAFQPDLKLRTPTLPSQLQWHRKNHHLRHIQENMNGLKPPIIRESDCKMIPIIYVFQLDTSRLAKVVAYFAPRSEAI